MLFQIRREGPPGPEIFLLSFNSTPHPSVRLASCSGTIVCFSECFRLSVLVPEQLATLLFIHVCSGWNYFRLSICESWHYSASWTAGVCIAEHQHQQCKLRVHRVCVLWNSSGVIGLINSLLQCKETTYRHNWDWTSQAKGMPQNFCLINYS